MSVLGSQLEIDMDPEGDSVIIPRHQVKISINYSELRSQNCSIRTLKMDLI